MATTRPKRVVKRASEIPEATIEGLISLAAAISSKARIIPETVPVNPNMGAMVTTVESQIIPRSKKASSMVPALSILFSTSETPLLALDNPAWKISAIGPPVSSHTFKAASTPPSFKACLTLGKKRLVIKVDLVSV